MTFVDVPSVSMLCSKSAVDGDSVAITSVAASSSRKQLRSAWQRREAKKGERNRSLIISSMGLIGETCVCGVCEVKWSVRGVSAEN